MTTFSLHAFVSVSCVTVAPTACSLMMSEFFSYRLKKKKETTKQVEITKHFPVRRSTRKCKSVLEVWKETDGVIINRVLISLIF